MELQRDVESTESIEIRVGIFAFDIIDESPTGSDEQKR